MIPYQNPTTRNHVSTTPPHFPSSHTSPTPPWSLPHLAYTPVVLLCFQQTAAAPAHVGSRLLPSLPLHFPATQHHFPNPKLQLASSAAPTPLAPPGATAPVLDVTSLMMCPFLMIPSLPNCLTQPSNPTRATQANPSTLPQNLVTPSSPSTPPLTPFSPNLATPPFSPTYCYQHPILPPPCRRGHHHARLSHGPPNVQGHTSWFPRHADIIVPPELQHDAQHPAHRGRGPCPRGFQFASSVPAPPVAAKT